MTPNTVRVDNGVRVGLVLAVVVALMSLTSQCASFPLSCGCSSDVTLAGPRR